MVVIEETGGDDPKLAELRGPDRTFAQMWREIFKPEVERRLAAGLVDKDFLLHTAQLLQPPGKKSRVLFNEEVRGVALMRAPRPIQKGDPILLADISHVEQYDLPEDLLDCGHFTMFRSAEGWLMCFNFLSGRAKARDMLKLASQFLDAAKESGRRDHAGPAVDNLFSASELIAKAELILHRSRAAEAKSHGIIASEINQWAQLGNIDAAFVALFNKLRRQRPNARYSDRQHRPPVPDSDSFDLVTAMIERGLERVVRSTDRNSNTDDG